MAIVRRRHVLASGHKRSGAAAEDGFAADGNGIEGGAVKGIPHRDEFEPARGNARELEGHANRRGAARREQHAI